MSLRTNRSFPPQQLTVKTTATLVPIQTVKVAGIARAGKGFSVTTDWNKAVQFSTLTWLPASPTEHFTFSTAIHLNICTYN
jgi:hypothetical protein